MGGNLRSGRNIGFQRLLDFSGNAMSVAEQHARWENEVKFDPVRVTEIAVPKVVVGDAALAGFSIKQLDDALLDGGIRCIHQSRESRSNQTDPGDEDVGRDQNADQGIGWSPTKNQG